MTRNNLNDQLSWLLANISLIAPSALSLPPARRPASASSSPTDETAFFTPTAGLSPTARPNEPPTTQLYPILPGGSSRPSTSVVDGAAAVKARSRESQQKEPLAGNMGRLTSKSNSKRPTLTLCQEQLPSPVSTISGASLSSDYPAFLAKNNSARNRIPAQDTPRESRPGSVFPTPTATLATSRIVDVVDLTRGGGQPSSVSTAFGSETQLWREDFASRPEPMISSDQSSVAFGNGKTIWREDYATRPAPISTDDDSVAFGSDVMVWEEEAAWRAEPGPTKRGTKRKSDQISQPPPIVPANDFTDIMDLLSDDESIRASMKQSPTKSPARSKLKTSPKKASSNPEVISATPSKPNTNILFDVPSARLPDGKMSPYKSPQKTANLGKLGGPKAVQANLDVWLSDSDSAFGGDSEQISRRDTKREAKTPVPMRSRERVIQDSDDEPMTPIPHQESERTILRTNSPAKRQQNSQHDRDVAIQNTPSKIRTTTTSQSATVSYSPQRKHRAKRSESKPVEFPDEIKQDNPTGTASSSQSDAQYDDKKLSAMLQLFIQQPLIIEMKRTALEEDLRQNRESFKKSLHEGSLKPRERLRRDKEKLIRQQGAVDLLANEYRSYEELIAKRDALIARIADAYEHDLDTDDDEAHLQGLDALIKDRQDSLKRHLFDAGIHEPAEYEGQAVHDFYTHRSESVVQATQAAKPTVPLSLSRESSQIPGMGGTQIIMQTQVPSRLDAHPPVIGSHSSEPSQSHGKGGQHVTSVPPRHATRDEHHSSVAVEVSRNITPIPPPASDIMDYEGGDLFETEDFLHDRNSSKGTRTTTRTTQQSSTAKSRRSPRKQVAPPREEYESDYSDGIDILELAHDIEKHSSAKAAPLKPTRPVLSETSGNLGACKEKSSTRKKRSATTAPPSPRRKKFPWYKDVKRALKDRFRMNGFRHNQLAAINATLAGKDAFILMPTGGGKSLCYQLPAVVTSGETSGITVVVSPLLSLMQDQVEHLRAINIAATTFNGETPAAAKKEIMNVLKQPHPELYFQLLYVTPEMINKSTAFRDGLACLYRNKKLARLVIDEAHCVSQWGHDFRPDYKELGSFRESFPEVPLMALTATATQNVIMDVKHNLGIDKCEQYTQSFNRPNLYYEVRRKEKDNTTTIAGLINSKYPGKTGIVYTLSRKNAETIAKKLREQGIAAHHYHANVDPDEKGRIQRDWQKGKIKVVVATIAFGMGIDKPDVRYVIHQSVPKSLEGYYQETGRAGRDGEASECYLYFGFGDVTQLRKMIADGEGSDAQKERQRTMLDKVAKFCDNQSECRRVEILRYFGETFTKAQCKATCDNCMSGDQFEQKDFTKYALAVIAIVRSANKITLAQCTDYLVGKKKRSDYEEVEQYHGMAKQLPKHEIHRVIDRLLAEEALREENIFNPKSKMAVQYYKIGRTARLFMTDGRKLWLTTRVKSASSLVATAGAQRRLDIPAAPATRKEHAVQFTSTLVSSPARRSSTKKKGKAVANYDEDSDEDFGTHGFVVGNDEHFDDDFEMMPPPRTRRGKTKPVGPPISRDVRLSEEGLTDIQKDILENFFAEAKTLEEKIRASHGFRQPLFTQIQLREMGLQWTITIDQMLQIPNIDKEKVKRFGGRFIPFIQRYHQQYQEIMGLPLEADTVPHLGDIVDLVTTDDDDDDDDDDTDDNDDHHIEHIEDDDDDEEGETSGYFQPPATEASFMEKFHRANQQEPSSSKSRARSSSTTPGRGGKSSWRGGGKKQYPSRRSSGSKFAGVKKKGATARKATSGPASRGSGSSSTAPRSRSSRTPGVGVSGIGLMDY